MAFLVIAHRMRTIEAADQIIVLDQGVVAESGNHDTLMKKHGLYRKLVELQTESANWKIWKNVRKTSLDYEKIYQEKQKINIDGKVERPYSEY